jgi:hypothetical protein
LCDNGSFTEKGIAIYQNSHGNPAMPETKSANQFRLPESIEFLEEKEGL